MEIFLSVKHLSAILVYFFALHFKYCNCLSGIYEYPEVVDFRIIVLTYNRPFSLVQCLTHVNRVITDGATVAVEVWVDRPENGDVNVETLHILDNITWSDWIVHRTHVHPVHAGLYGQWLTTWRPKFGSREIVLYLEDDVDISPYAYRWLRRAYGAYRKNPELAGISLKEEYVITASGSRRGVSLKTPDYDPIYFYRIVGPWGFAPHPEQWRRFQDWYFAEKNSCRQLDPHVPEAGLYDSWYTDMQQENRTDSMWIMWYISYCHRNSLYTAYSNLRAYSKDPGAGLVVNRREDGLHFSGRRRNNTDQFLLGYWDEKFVKFPEKITKLDYDGSYS